jgi:hypothetical protein
MSKLRSLSILLLTLSLFSILGCETDIDIIAPKKDVTIVYGILEETKTRHYIRINKAFIGEESASVLAATQGVNEYSDSELQAVVIEYLNGEERNRWPLSSEYISSKEDGLFFSDSNKVYYFDADLRISSDQNTFVYRLECTINVEGEETKVVSAETEVIGGGIVPITLVKPRIANSSSEDRAEIDFVANGEYRNSLDITWQRPAGGVSFTSYYRFYYTEVDITTGERKRDSLLYMIGTKRVKLNESESSGEVNFTMNPEEFYIRMNTEFEDYNFDNPSFYRYASDTLEFFLEIADNTLATYIEVNQPSTEISQERPEYTNVTNGIGVFGSRYIATTRVKGGIAKTNSGRVFESGSLEELLYSNQVTGLDPETGQEFSHLTSKKGFKVENGRCNDETRTCR